MAGGLKQELKSKYGIRPRMRHQYHELEVLVNGRSVFCYTKAPRIPTVPDLVRLIEEAAEVHGAKVAEQTG